MRGFVPIVLIGLAPGLVQGQERVPMYLDQNITAGVLGANADRNSVVLGNQMLSMLQMQHEWMLMTRWAVAGEQKMAQGRAGTSYQPSQK